MSTTSSSCTPVTHLRNRRRRRHVVAGTVAALATIAGSAVPAAASGGGTRSSAPSGVTAAATVGPIGSVFGPHHWVHLELDRITTSPLCGFPIGATTEVHTVWGGAWVTYEKTAVVHGQAYGQVIPLGPSEGWVTVNDPTFHTPASAIVQVHGAKEISFTVPLALDAAPKLETSVTVGVTLPGRLAPIACLATLAFRAQSADVDVPPVLAMP